MSNAPRRARSIPNPSDSAPAWIAPRNPESADSIGTGTGARDFQDRLREVFSGGAARQVDSQLEDIFVPEEPTPRDELEPGAKHATAANPKERLQAPAHDAAPIANSSDTAATADPFSILQAIVSRERKQNGLDGLDRISAERTPFERQAHYRQSENTPDHPVVAAMRVMLSELGWQTDLEIEREACERLALQPTIGQFRKELALLGYATDPAGEQRFDAIGPEDVPCLFVRGDGALQILLRVDRRRGFVESFDSETGKHQTIRVPETRGQVFLIQREDGLAIQDESRKTGIVSSVLRRYRGVTLAVMGSTFGVATLACVVPLLLVLLFDSIVPTGSPQALPFVLLAMLATGGAEILLRYKRFMWAAYLRTRLQQLLSSLRLPAIPSPDTPAARSRQHRDGSIVWEALAGRLHRFGKESAELAVLDGGLAAFWALLAFALLPIAGWVFSAVYLLCGFNVAIGSWLVHRASARLEELRDDVHEVASELTDRADEIREASAQELWMTRLREATARILPVEERSRRVVDIYRVVGGGIGVLGGLVLYLNLVDAMRGQYSTLGVAVGCAMLYVRFHMTLQSATRHAPGLWETWEQLSDTQSLLPAVSMANHPDESGARGSETLNGSLLAEHVSTRPTGVLGGALESVSFEVKPGHLVAIVGRSGAGKTCLLRVLAGLHPIWRGRVLIGGIEHGQISAVRLRRAVAYLPQRTELVTGTLRENIAICADRNARQEVDSALREFGLLAELEYFPEGGDTWLTPARVRGLPTGVRQRIGLARTFSRNASLYLLDEPERDLDEAGDRAFKRRLASLKRRTTTIFSSHRPSHIELADHVVFLDEGRIADQGPPARLIPKLRTFLRRARVSVESDTRG